MQHGIYRYTFGPEVSMMDVEETLMLSVLAGESLHGRAQVRLDAAFCLDARKRCCVVDARSEVGRNIARIFTGFVTREFGDGGFKVERVSDQEEAAAAMVGGVRDAAQ